MSTYLLTAIDGSKLRLNVYTKVSENNNPRLNVYN